MSESDQCHSVPAPPSDNGLTILVDPAEPSLDIVFVHGFTGHPEHTWTHKTGEATGNVDNNGPRRLKIWRPKRLSNSSHAAVYWPRDLLPGVAPNARIMVHGYDTRIRHAFGKPVSQNTVYDIAGDFLIALEAHRRTEPDRQIMFVVHSLGGIVVKEMLRRSRGSDMDRAHLRTIFESTVGIMFFGTPHGGADPRGILQHIAEKAIRAAGFKPNDQIVNTLLPTAERLKELRDEFGPVAQREDWIIHSFQEELGVKVLGGRKVVEDTSSYLNIPAIEITEHIGRNHMEMCRFTGLADPEYKKVTAALQRMTEQLSREPKGTPCPPVGGTPTKKHRGELTKKQKEELLESLKFDHIDFRRLAIKRAHPTTCHWLLECPAYLDWNDLDRLPEHYGFIWIKGKPGAGKSTIMKFALENALENAKDDIIISFFFNARGHALEKSTIGMYRSLLFQLLNSLPHLHCVFDSLRLIEPNTKDYQWEIEPLKSLFEQAVLKLESESASCFIDALDECEESQVRDMVSFFEHIGELTVSTKVHFRVCFSSRYYPHVTTNKGYSLELENSNGHEQDIISYLDSKLAIGSSKLAKAIRDEIQDKASGVFMWVVLVVGILNTEFDDGRLHALQARLRELPRDLHELFHQLLTRDNRNKDELLLCIRWVLYAMQPLNIQQLYFAILSSFAPEKLSSADFEDITQYTMERFILSSSKGLVEIGLVEDVNDRPPRKDTRAQFIHESVRDYLVKEGGLRKLWPDLGANIEGESHEVLKQCCLDFIRRGIASRIGMLDSSESDSYNSENDESDSSNSKYDAEITALPFLCYSLDNVLEHAERAQISGIDQTQFLQSFPVMEWTRLYTKLNLSFWREFHRPSVLYILAECNLPALIRCHPSGKSCFRQEDERYGMPFLAALEERNTEACGEFIRILRQGQPLNSPLHEICETFLESYETHFRSRYLTQVSEYRVSQSFSDMVYEFYSYSEDFNTDLKLRNDGKTALALAIGWGNDLLVRLLLRKGHDVNERDLYGRSPLSWAVEHRFSKVLKLLLDNGANINTTWPENGHYPSEAQSYAVSKLDRLKLRYSTEAMDKQGECRGWTLLHGAAYCNDYGSAKILLDKGVDVMATDAFGRTPLMLAASEGHDELAELLIGRGADINSRDNDGNTAYQHAALHGHEDIMEYLEYSGLSLRLEMRRSGDEPTSWNP